MGKGSEMSREPIFVELYWRTVVGTNFDPVCKFLHVYY